MSSSEPPTDPLAIPEAFTVPEIPTARKTNTRIVTYQALIRIFEKPDMPESFQFELIDLGEWFAELSANDRATLMRIVGLSVDDLSFVLWLLNRLPPT